MKLLFRKLKYENTGISEKKLIQTSCFGCKLYACRVIIRGLRSQCPHPKFAYDITLIDVIMLKLFHIEPTSK